LEKAMRQQSFTAEDFKKYKKKTRKEVFLEEMDQIIPWQEMSEAVKPHYPYGVIIQISALLRFGGSLCNSIVIPRTAKGIKTNWLSEGWESM